MAEVGINSRTNVSNVCVQIFMLLDNLVRRRILMNNDVSLGISTSPIYLSYFCQ